MKDLRGLVIGFLGFVLLLVVCITLFSSQSAHKKLESELQNPGMPWPQLTNMKFTVYDRDIGPRSFAGALSTDFNGTVWLLSVKPGTPITMGIDAVSPASPDRSILLRSGVVVSHMAWNTSNTAWLWDQWSDRIVRLDSRHHPHLVALPFNPSPIFGLAVAPSGDAWFTKIAQNSGPYHNYHTAIGMLDARGNTHFTDLSVAATQVIFDAKGDFWFLYGAHNRPWPFDPAIWARSTGGVGVMRMNRSVGYYPSEHIIEVRGEGASLVRSKEGTIWFLNMCGVIGRVEGNQRLNITELPFGACPSGLAADNRDGVWFFDNGLAYGPRTVGHMDDSGRLQLFRASAFTRMSSLAVDRNGDVWITGSIGRQDVNATLKLAKFIPPVALRYKL